MRRLLAFAIALVLSAPAYAATRAAVVVGANAAVPGRSALRYAHRDASSIASTLVEVADFPADGVDLLLEARPEEILAALDRRLAQLRLAPGETMLIFYFSGHADGDALYSGGAPLPLRDLKERLSDTAAGVRVGIVDACSGGAWTGTKGLRPAAEFEVNLPLTLGSEGSALLAASSGHGDAHESELVGGSFFTHHLVAALRGAGDRSEDGEVTLLEAFDYAQPLTIRDSAVIAGFPQRPSFEINLRGRRDLTLSRIAARPNRIHLGQEKGPLQVIRLDSGLVVLEVPAGRRTIVASLPPGRYVVRRSDAGSVWAKEVVVRADAPLAIHERELAPLESGALASKGAAPAAEPSSLPGGDWALQVATGRMISGERYTGSAEAELGGFWDARVGLTDRLQLSLAMLQLDWRLGSPDGTEVLMLAGTNGWGLVDGGLVIFPTFGAHVRLWAGPRGSVVIGASAMSVFSHSDSPQAFDEWRGEAQAGWMLRVGDRVTLSIGAVVDQPWTDPRRSQGGGGGRWTPRGAEVELGSVLRLGAARVPIAAVELFDGVFVDGYAAVRIDPRTGGMEESFLGGVTWRP